jgi:NAD kinase
LAVLMVGRIIE